MTPPTGMRSELRSMARLAGPVVAAELAWMGMGVADTIMVGRLGAEAIGAVGIGRLPFTAIVFFGMGLLLGLDTLVSMAHGAGSIADCQRSLLQAVYLSGAVSVPLTCLVRAVIPLLDVLGIDARVGALAKPYLDAISWACLPLLLYGSFRRYLQGVNRVRPVFVALVSANLVNVAANWIFIYGKLGAPALGTAGAGWATLVACWYLAVFLLCAVFLHGREERTGFVRASLRPEAARIGRLIALGLPAATQMLVEVSVFAAATALAGRLDTGSLAAHQIALTLASVTFMVPLGFSSAAAVRVGQALGRRDPARASRAGWAALLLGSAFMLLAALAFLLLARPLIRLFTSDPAVVSVGVSLLAVAGLFQLSDGLQVVATGALRGAADTRAPLVWNVVGHWILGLPAGYVLCFVAGFGVVGLWIGWLIGLSVAGGMLVLSWRRASRSFAH